MEDKNIEKKPDKNSDKKPDKWLTMIFVVMALVIINVDPDKIDFFRFIAFNQIFALMIWTVYRN